MMGMFKPVLMIVLLLASLPASSSLNIPDAADVFRLSARRAANGEVLLEFDVQPGNALYRDRIRVTGLGETRVLRVVKPDGVIPMDVPEAGQQYRGRTIIRVSVESGRQPVRLLVRSQGCADIGICYPQLVHQVELP